MQSVHCPRSCQSSVWGRNPTPKSIALAMALRQLTGSASVISLLSGFGHCMSHSYVICHESDETALAQMNISNDSAILPGFASDIPTTLAWDNDDFSEETRSGKGTTLITGGIIIQREQSTITEQQKRDSIPRCRSIPAPSKEINPYLQTIKPVSFPFTKKQSKQTNIAL